MSLYSSSLWRTDTIVNISKLNKPPISVSPLLNGLEINKPLGGGGGGLNKGFTVNIFLILCCDKHSFPFMCEYPGSWESSLTTVSVKSPPTIHHNSKF